VARQQRYAVQGKKPFAVKGHEYCLQRLMCLLGLNSSFSCAADTALQCVSGSRDPATERAKALYVQIRWKESDLPSLETPPLTSGLPSSRLHRGWDPDGSLLSVYTFPADCSSYTDTYIPFGRTSCVAGTGKYYSPAICPEGWTAAYTRPVLGNLGPPEEPDETAMFCCPRYGTLGSMDHE